ncbi:helix-turn-helix domain-containing protein [Flavitalea antarctica]
MPEPRTFPFYHSINEWHAALSTGIQTLHDDIHIFRYEDVINNVVLETPYYKDAFFHITFATDMDAVLHVNDKAYECREGGLFFFISPDQLIHWKRTKSNWKGFVLLVKPKFLTYSIQGSLLLKELILFHQDKIHVTPVPEASRRQVEIVFENILEEYCSNEEWKFEMIRSYIKILLIHAQRINRSTALLPVSREEELLFNFQSLVNRFFSKQRSVYEYAQQLNVHPTHLSETIKKKTGKTASAFIRQRVLLEAQCLLAYTSLDISQIAYELNFDEPSNFMRFFKTYEKKTPSAYRASLSMEKD